MSSAVVIGTWALTMLWADSADDKLAIFFLFFQENRIWHFMRIVSLGDNLHEVSDLRRQFAWSVRSYFLVKIRKIFQNVLLKFLPSMQSVKG